MTSHSLNLDEDDIRAIQRTLAFSAERKNQVAREHAIFKGIEHTTGTGTSTASVTDIDWDINTLSQHTSSRDFPPGLAEDEFNVFQYSGAILFIAATHSITLPITHSQLADVILMYYFHTAGYSAGEYIAGQELLKSKYKTSLITNYTRYAWPGYTEFSSKVRESFMERLRTENYNCFDDLFKIYEGHRATSSSKADSGSESNEPGPSHAKPSVRDAHEAMPFQESTNKEVTQLERDLIRLIKEYFAAKQLVSIGVAFGYLLVRPVAKSTEHAIIKGKGFGKLPTRYGLDMNPSITFNFAAQAIEAIRINMTAYASTVATYLQSLIEFMDTPEVATSVPERCKIQIKALTEIRLAFFWNGARIKCGREAQDNSGSAGLIVVDEIDSEMAKVLKRRLMEKRKAPSEKYTGLVSSRVPIVPHVQEPGTSAFSSPATVSVEAFKNLSGIRK
ncbi:unnamed protein product [Haemonchus placei]|uniref:Mitochondrial outer membrane protein IML2 n=1 Tax=Haemonchus placei TaxID=6290 RepID=A0A0N4WDF6_HAEPC|nr:unnamed protein product [Haemonchus placei]